MYDIGWWKTSVIVHFLGGHLSFFLKCSLRLNVDIQIMVSLSWVFISQSLLKGVSVKCHIDISVLLNTHESI